MKNLIHLGIDYLESLPVNPRSIELEDSWKKYWRGGRGQIHHRKNIWPYDRAQWLIEKNIGRSFAVTFSRFCCLVPKYQQSVFLDNFRVEQRRYRYNRVDGSADYLIDEEGLIQEWGIVKPEKKEYIKLRSSDFKTEKRYKATGRVWQSIPMWMRSKENDEKLFIEVVISGWERVFTSRRDPVYRRLTKEKQQKERITYKKKKKEEREKAYTFLTKSEIERKRDRSYDYYRIIAHGMDPLTSFTQN